MLHQLRYNTVFRYIAAGGLSYLVEIATILLLIHLLNISDITSVAIAFWVGLLFSFILQKVFTFSNKTTRKKTVKQLVLYIVLVGVNYLFTLALVIALKDILDVTLTRTIALVITTAWNFLFYSKVIFRTH